MLIFPAVSLALYSPLGPSDCSSSSPASNKELPVRWHSKQLRPTYKEERPIIVINYGELSSSHSPPCLPCLAQTPTAVSCAPPTEDKAAIFNPIRSCFPLSYPRYKGYRGGCTGLGRGGARHIPEHNRRSADHRYPEGTTFHQTHRYYDDSELVSRFLAAQ